MTKKLSTEEINVAVALTEGIVSKAISQRLEIWKKSLCRNSHSSTKSSSTIDLQPPTLVKEQDSEKLIYLVGGYTKSPLTWSIAVAPNSTITSVHHLKKIGISRYGSGSHIMAIVLAQQLGISFEFVVCNDIRGLIDAVTAATCDAFLWYDFLLFQLLTYLGYYL